MMKIFVPFVCLYCCIVNLCGGMTLPTNTNDNDDIVFGYSVLSSGDIIEFLICKNMLTPCVLSMPPETTISGFMEYIRSIWQIPVDDEMACFTNNGQLNERSTLRFNKINLQNLILVLRCPKYASVSLETILQTIEERKQDVSGPNIFTTIKIIEESIQINSNRRDLLFRLCAGNVQMNDDLSDYQEEQQEPTVIPSSADKPSCAPLPCLTFH